MKGLIPAVLVVAVPIGLAAWGVYVWSPTDQIPLADIQHRLERLEVQPSSDPVVLELLRQIREQQPQNTSANETKVRKIPFVVRSRVTETSTQDGQPVTETRWVYETRYKEVRYTGEWPEELSAFHPQTTGVGIFECYYAGAMSSEDFYSAQTAVRQASAGDGAKALQTVRSVGDDWSRGHILSDHLIGLLDGPEQFEDVIAIAETIQRNPEAKANMLAVAAVNLQSYGRVDIAKTALEEAGKARRIARQQSAPDLSLPPVAPAQQDADDAQLPRAPSRDITGDSESEELQRREPAVTDEGRSDNPTLSQEVVASTFWTSLGRWLWTITAALCAVFLPFLHALAIAKYGRPFAGVFGKEVLPLLNLPDSPPSAE